MGSDNRAIIGGFVNTVSSLQFSGHAADNTAIHSGNDLLLQGNGPC